MRLVTTHRNVGRGQQLTWCAKPCIHVVGILVFDAQDNCGEVCALAKIYCAQNILISWALSTQAGTLVQLGVKLWPWGGIGGEANQVLLRVQRDGRGSWAWSAWRLGGRAVGARGVWLGWTNSSFR